MSLEHEHRYCVTCKAWHNVFHMRSTCDFPKLDVSAVCDKRTHDGCDDSECGCMCHRLDSSKVTR